MIQKENFRLSDMPYKKNVTLYSDTNVKPRACILYFHGGGLLYGSRSDLPALHIETLTKAGFPIISFDYPLAPYAKLDAILDDVCNSINSYHDMPNLYTPYIDATLPCFLWGRSAGAYLCLLAAASDKLHTPPQGILSYYGYGFLCDNWYNTPSNFYRTLPAVDESCLKNIPDKMHGSGNLDTHYSVYVYARQTGYWQSLIYEGREKYFFLNYSLRTCTALPCPLFCAHSTGDTDVPYAEFQELCSRYSPQRFIASGDTHDFDRNEDDPFTLQLLSASVHFLEKHL